MTSKLVISNTVECPVSFTLNDAGRLRAFNFSLLATRKPAAELLEFIRLVSTPGEDHDQDVVQMLLDTVIGWRNQSLVVDEASGLPADFTREGLELVLGLMGVPALAFVSYIGACSDKGKAKN